MIKVFEFIPLMANGGAETLVKDYCKQLDKDEFDVTVVVMGEFNNYANEITLQEMGQRVVYLGECKYGRNAQLNPLKKGIRFISRYLSFRRLVKQERPDLIHIHLHVGNYFRFIPKKILKSTKLVYTVHNVFDNYFSKSIKNIRKYHEYRELYRLIHKYDTKLITLHDEMNANMRREFDTENVHTVWNGIELDRFVYSENERKMLREEANIPQSAYVIGNVGRFHEQKNHDFIVDIFAKVAKENRDAYLLLVGKGQNTKQKTVDKLQELGLYDRTVILQDRKDVPAIMSAMDVFLFPSRWEGFGNVLIEAQSIGLHCVVSDCVPKEVIVSNRVTVLSLDEGVDKWVEMLSDDAVVTTADHSIKEHDIECSIGKVADIYRQMVNA